jgi:hypothetical protein
MNCCFFHHIPHFKPIENLFPQWKQHVRGICATNENESMVYLIKSSCNDFTWSMSQLDRIMLFIFQEFKKEEIND